MSPRKTPSKPQQRGEILPLPSGSLKVRVYAGRDALTGKKHFLTETIPSTHPELAKEAERVRTRFLNQVDEQRGPRTSATVDKLMDDYLEKINVDKSTRLGYESKIRNHIKPLIGHVKVAKLDAHTIDSFYATLRACSAHCGGKGKFIEHRTKRDHACNEKCRPHSCEGLSVSTIRQIHSILGGALKRAVKWDWLRVNPLDQAEAPPTPTPNPHPPEPEEAAAVLNAAFRDFTWGVFVWLTMVTGARRGEMCALRWSLLDLDRAVLQIKTSIGQEGKETWEKDTKTHQQRRIALDQETVALLRAYRQRCEESAKEFAQTIERDGRIFSNSVDHSTYWKPDTVSQRYSRLCDKLDIDTDLHSLRHYSATELIGAGVDPRTVAGRLGHGGGGATTLKVYSAWVSEADQRAAGNLRGRMPTVPVTIDVDGSATTTVEPEIRGPYQQIAADLRGAIVCGALKPGDNLPTVVELCQRYNVAAGTANRAVAELKAAGLVTASRGKRAVVAPLSESSFANVVSLKSKRAGK
ncbi:tyrosine-type recombinase/integrase [Streptomyces sp. ID05-26A]|nr:tyrosine-type recombinase/integrase [Streptomyces sp. ID05-26A]